LTPALPALTGTDAIEPPPFPAPPAVALPPCAAGAQALLWFTRPPTLALTPQAFTEGLPALIGALATDPLPLPALDALLPWGAGAQLLV
jgi:hypothetical protein